MLYIIPDGETSYFTRDRETALKLSEQIGEEINVKENQSLEDVIAYFGFYIREKDKPLSEPRLISMKDLVGSLMFTKGEKEIKFSRHREFKKAFRIHNRKELEKYFAEADSISHLDETSPVRIEWEKRMSSYRDILKCLIS